MVPYHPEIHRRRSIRLKGYDYTTAGAYFVTLVTKDRVCWFGDVVNGEMIWNKYGKICADAWLWLARQYDYVELIEWVIMPNHLHGIIVIIDGVDATGRGGSRTAPTTITMGTKRKPLGRLIGAFKTVSTKRINEMRRTPGEPIWQRNYYEHIIRNKNELNRIRQYIMENPLRWELDRENPYRAKRQ